MSKQIPIDDIVNGVLEGYVLAQNGYEEMSGGRWLWQAPEYFITSAVANKLNKLDGAKYITLEHRSSDALRDAGAKGRGRLPKDAREKGKVDIVLWWGSNSPRAIIEVKTRFTQKINILKILIELRHFLFAIMWIRRCSLVFSHSTNQQQMASASLHLIKYLTALKMSFIIPNHC